MTVHMTIVEDIRRLDSRGVSNREIARRLKPSAAIEIAKYINIEDFSPTPPTPTKRVLPS